MNVKNSKFFHIVIFIVSLIFCTNCSSTTSSVVNEDSKSTSAEVVETLVVEEPYILQSVPEAAIEITSSAVSRSGRLNKYYTCEGADVSPELSWSGAPEGTKSFVVFMEDPASDEVKATGGVMWTHWMLYSIPGFVNTLSEEIGANAVLDNGAKHGTNDYGKPAYSGPCPEPTVYVKVEGCRGTGSGCVNKETHPAEKRTYNFYVYALDIELDLIPGLTRNELLGAIEGHIIGIGMLAGEYRSMRKLTKAGGSFG